MTGSIRACYRARVKRWPTISLALLAGTAFALSVQGGRWWVIDTAEIGPFGMRVCTLGTCTSGSLANVGGDPTWMRFGIATWAAGLLVALAVLVLAARVAAKKLPRLVAKLTLSATLTAALAGVGFLLKFPDDRMPAAELARGVVLFAIAIPLAAAAAITVLRARETPTQRRVAAVDTPG